MGEIGPILTNQMVGIGGLSKVSEYGMIHLGREPLIHLSMLSEQKKNCMYSSRLNLIFCHRPE